jgi:hypothetical protein
MKRWAMDRRTFLRGLLGGAAVGVGLPTLEVMLNTHGTALADGAPLPTRFGVWFWGNGVRPERWVPARAGANWEPSEELEPLRALRPWVSVVSGCEIKTGTHPHHSGMTGVMTGAALHQVGVTRDTIVSTFARQSVDQIAADRLAGQAALRSLEVGITRFRGTDEGTTFQHLSHNGPNNPNPAEYEPRALFERLFGGPREGRPEETRASVLDAVRGQIRGLQQRVGRADRARLEQHFESVRALERRIAASPNACAAPAAPGQYPDVEGREQIAPRNQIMSELIALALACDMTRVFSVLYSTAGSGVIVWQAGARNGLHQICHDEPNPQPTVHAATTFTMEQLAAFLGALRDTPEGAGSVLDHCSILCTTELSDGHTHSNQDFPILIAGKGGGRLRGDMHYRSPGREGTSRAVLTALRGAGLEEASFGVDAGRETQSLGALEA